MKGHIGTGQVTVISFAVPEHSLSYWKRRLSDGQVSFEEGASAFDEPLVSFSDEDGIQIELISTVAANRERTWGGGAVPAEFALCGFHHVTLSEEGYERTASLLTDTLGFRLVQQQRNRFRYAVGSGEPGTPIDLLCVPGAKPGRIAVGTVHHVALRAPTDDEQVSWKGTIGELKYNVTPVIDRTYFMPSTSANPAVCSLRLQWILRGFTVDERQDQLGSRLVLPSRLEPDRLELEGLLPKIRVPATVL